MNPNSTKTTTTGPTLQTQSTELGGRAFSRSVRADPGFSEASTARALARKVLTALTIPAVPAIPAVATLLALAGVLVACGPALEEFDATQTESGDEIINGHITTGYPSVVLLAIERPSGGVYCSGTVIGEHTVLTAGHCIIDDEGQNAVAVRIWGGQTASRWAAHPAYDHEDFYAEGAGTDVAIAHFDDTPGPVMSIGAAPATGTNVRVVGFGRYDRSIEELDGQKRTALNRLDTVAETYIAHSGPKTICSGDSGGAVMTADGTQLIGVISRGGRGCRGAGYSALVSGSLAWIQEASDEAPSNPEPPANDDGNNDDGNNGDGNNGDGDGDNGGDDNVVGGTEYPVFRGGNVDTLDEYGVIHGWCAEVKGPVSLEPVLFVHRNGALVGALDQANEDRDDVKLHIEAWYESEGYAVSLPNNRFGFAFQTTGPGEYTFTCGARAIGGRTIEASSSETDRPPILIERCNEDDTTFAVTVSVPVGHPVPWNSNVVNGVENPWEELYADRWIPEMVGDRIHYVLTKNGRRRIQKADYPAELQRVEVRFRTSPTDTPANRMPDNRRCIITF
ncbi:MAG: trypsin-like serine protease [Deltaproteobacteria bacterium]|nr:trypsin-like serine protease [Deltaproteobacteria bacterium]